MVNNNLLAWQQLAPVTQAGYQNYDDKYDAADDLHFTGGQSHHGQSAVQDSDGDGAYQTSADLGPGASRKRHAAQHQGYHDIVAQTAAGGVADGPGPDHQQECRNGDADGADDEHHKGDLGLGDTALLCGEHITAQVLGSRSDGRKLEQDHTQNEEDHKADNGYHGHLSE